MPRRPIPDQADFMRCAKVHSPRSAATCAYSILRMGVPEWTGGARWGWAPNLLLWAGLVAGSACGALAYHWLNLAAIWFAAAAALALSGMSAFLTRPGER